MYNMADAALLASTRHTELGQENDILYSLQSLIVSVLWRATTTVKDLATHV